MPLLQPLSMLTPPPLPLLSALTLQRGVPPLQYLSVHAPLPPPISVLIQGIGAPHLQTSAVLIYDPMLW